MAWNEVDEWNALGAAGEGIKNALAKAATYMEQVAADSTKLARNAAEHAKTMASNLDELRAATVKALDDVYRSRLNSGSQELICPTW